LLARYPSASPSPLSLAGAQSPFTKEANFFRAVSYPSLKRGVRGDLLASKGD
jgi:hypothetical protein